MINFINTFKLPKSEKLIILTIFLFSLIPRLTLFHTEFWRSPDSIEYINVAKNLIVGKGFTQSIKWHFFDPSPVVTSALKGRPPLTYFVFASILFIKDDPYLIQLFLLILGAINIVLFYKLARIFLSKQISFFASFVAALNPNLLITNRLNLSEVIFTSFVLCFFILFFQKKKNTLTYILLGVLSAISYLTRFEGFFLLPLILLIKTSKKNLLISIFSFLILTFPYFYSNFLINHNPFYSYNTFHFKVFHIREGMWEGFGKDFPSFLTFFKQNAVWIIKTITNLTIYNFLSIIGIGSLSFLSLTYLIKGKELLKKFTPFFIFSFLSFSIFSIIWSVFTEAERHFSTIYLLLLLPIFTLLNTEWKKLLIVLISLTLVFYIGLDIHRIYWARFVEPTIDNFGLEDKKKIYNWIEKNTPNDAIIASDNPWMMYLNTNRPSIIFASDIEKKGQLENYIKTYKVSLIVNRGKLKRKLAFYLNGIYIYCGLACK